MSSLDRRSLLLGTGASLGLACCGRSESRIAPVAAGKAGRLIAAARAQIGVTTRYDPAYSVIAFPRGDVPRGRGTCTDVVIRAYRDALGLDLQALVNADMRAAFGAYPHGWGLKAPDRNIDHRRVPNLRTWLRRHRAALPVPANGSGWRPGDIFTSLVGGTGTHIGLVSDRRGRAGWQIIHNIGAGTREEDALLAWPITGRYRWALD
ncbi:MAG TPA: DUF1287 domain-containing protein [Allosphingosinicella sp.]|nr:DUF1287 domain-containing protein [Allosphingosinicella sp.]